MKFNPPSLVWLAALALMAAILYFLWPYIVAFLAICGVVQILRIWQRNRQRNPHRHHTHRYGKF